MNNSMVTYKYTKALSLRARVGLVYITSTIAEKSTFFWKNFEFSLKNSRILEKNVEYL